MKEVDEMRRELLEFIKRAASKNATPEEVAALPEVAKVFLESFMYP